MKADMYTESYDYNSSLAGAKCIYMDGRTGLKCIIRFGVALVNKNYWRTNES